MDGGSGRLVGGTTTSPRGLLGGFLDSIILEDFVVFSSGLSQGKSSGFN